MAMKISQRINKKGERQYRLWTTISDGWLTKWCSRKKALQYLAWDMEFHYKKRFIEVYYRFPHDFGDKDAGVMRCIVDEEGNKRLSEWNEKVMKSFESNYYYDLIESEYKKIMKELNPSHT